MLTSTIGFTNNDKPQVEILHWWSSAGESAALKVFIDTFRERGGYYYDSTKNDQVASRDEAIERMSKGYPSTLTQWNAGRDVAEFFEFGLTNQITDPALVAKLKKTLPEAVLDAVSLDDKIIALPVNIHSENWMWYSKELIDQTQKLPSNDWQTFINRGRELAKADIPLLAVGDQRWQVRILFTSLLLGLSRDVYKEFYIAANPEVIDQMALMKALSTFNQLAKYSKSFGDGNWNTQVKAVAHNKAGATFMGDWAKGEFHVLGKSPGDYGCALTATDDPSLLLVIDTFILGKVTSIEEQQGQALMLDVVSDPAVNLQFNALKGSISPYSKPAAEQLDACSSQVYDVLSNKQAVIPPYGSYGNGTYIDQIDEEIYRLWKASQDSGDDEAIVAVSAERFRKILEIWKKESTESFATMDE